jgi:hypothetical protein
MTAHHPQLIIRPQNSAFVSRESSSEKMAYYLECLYLSQFSDFKAFALTTRGIKMILIILQDKQNANAQMVTAKLGLVGRRRCSTLGDTTSRLSRNFDEVTKISLKACFKKA